MTRAFLCCIGLTAIVNGGARLASVRAQAAESKSESSEAASANDAAGWDDSSASANGASADDAAGWGGSQAAPVVQAPPEPAGNARRSALSLQGRYRLRLAMWTKRFDPRHPLAQALNLLGLRVRDALDTSAFGAPLSLVLVASARCEYDAAFLVHREDFDRPSLQTYEFLLRLDETYASLVAGALELRFGRLKLPLGQGELLSFMNVLNPRDLRDPGMGDPEDATVAVLGSRASLTIGTHTLEAIVVHEADFGWRAPPLGRLSPTRALLLGDPLSGPSLATHTWNAGDVPAGFAPELWQALGHYSFAGGGVDLDLVGGSVLDGLGVAALPSPSALLQPAVTLNYYHGRYPLFGHSGALALGEFLLRWELVAEIDRPQSVRYTDSAVLRIDAERHSQFDGLLGLTYFGTEGANFGIELADSYVLHNPARTTSDRALLLPIESPSLGFRASYSMLEDHLQLMVFALVIGFWEFNAALVRGDLGCKLTEGLHLAAGYIAYFQSARRFGPLYGLTDVDRVYLELRWNFSL